MKKNLWMFFGLPRCGVGAVLLALCALTPVSRADVIINNTGDAFDTSLSGIGNPLAQVFTISSSTSGNLNSLTLSLNIHNNSSQTVTIYLYSASGAPTGSGTVLGTFNAASYSTGDQPITLSLSSSGLSAGSYAIGLGAPTAGSVTWDATLTSGSGGTATSPLGGIYRNSQADGSGIWTAVSQSGIDLPANEPYGSSAGSSNDGHGHGLWRLGHCRGPHPAAQTSPGGLNIA